MGNWWEPTHHFSLVQMFNTLPTAKPGLIIKSWLLSQRRRVATTFYGAFITSTIINLWFIFASLKLILTLQVNLPSIFESSFLCLFHQIIVYLYKKGFSEIWPAYEYSSFISVFVLNQYTKVQIQYLTDNE